VKKPFCVKCQEMRPEKFCHACGTRLVESVRPCANCGYEDIWPHENYCCQCGTLAPPLPEKSEVAEAK
jgi:hypothetical protein